MTTKPVEKTSDGTDEAIGAAIKAGAAVAVAVGVAALGNVIIDSLAKHRAAKAAKTPTAAPAKPTA